LEEYWLRASERVDVMKNIDQLKNQLMQEIEQGNVRRRYKEQIERLRYRVPVENCRNDMRRRHERDEEYWRRIGHYCDVRQRFR
jgi:hypothetical protein